MIKNVTSLKNINKKHVHHFRKEGYLYIKDAFKKKDLKNLENSIILSLKKILKQKKIFIKKNNFNNQLAELRNKNPKIFAEYFDTLQTMSLIYSLLARKEILNLMQKLLGVSKVYITLTDVSIRLDAPNDERNKLGWHQDSSYYRQNTSGKNGIVLWTPLINQIKKEIGPLQFLKNSFHLGPLNIKKKKKNTKFGSKKRNISKNLLNKYTQIFEPEMNRGDILLLNLDMVHRSGNNLSNKFRISMIGRYHNSLSKDFNSGINFYRFTNKILQKEVHG